MTKRRTDWRTPLDIPEGRAGDFAIEHCIVPAGQGVMLNNVRTMMFGQGPGPREVTFPEDTRWHLLTEDGARWMSDWPIEQRQHDTELKSMKGRVLVGGLGIGYASHVLAHKKQVGHITVVEISKDVINLVEPWIRKRPGADVKVVHAELFDFLKEYKDKPFHHAFYDIWRSDGEGTFHQTVAPLHQLSRGVVRNRPVCWNEDVMRGQLFRSITSKLLFLQPEVKEHLKLPNLPVEPWEDDGTDNPWHNWMVPFFRWWKKASPSTEKAQEMARHYASVYGLADWMRLWNFTSR